MKEFNITENCVSDLHYMIDISQKLNEIEKLINDGKCFTINRVR